MGGIIACLPTDEISKREGETDDAGDMGDNCYRGLESTAHPTQKQKQNIW